MKTLSIIIPVYNEEKFIGKCIDQVVGADSLDLVKEIIVVDDGSTDHTNKKIKNKKLKIKNSDKKSKLSLKLIALPKNSGKGVALREGFAQSTGDIVLVQDADLEYNPADYPTLLFPFVQYKADVVYGSRFITDRPHRVLYFWHSVGNGLMTLFSNIVTNLNLTDIYTGYKVFRGDLIRSLAPTLTSRGFEIEAELTKKIARQKNLQIYEVGISYSGRTYAEGKKIRWWNAGAGVWKLLTS